MLRSHLSEPEALRAGGPRALKYGLYLFSFPGLYFHSKPGEIAEGRDKLHGVKYAMLLLIFAFLFSGCSTLVSPYSSKLQCPNTYKGKCVSVQTAYAESIDNPLVRERSKKKVAPLKTCEKKDRDKAALKKVDPKYEYHEALYRKLASMIEKPSTPIVVPPEVVRVLILSYTGSENELFSYRYVYFFATEPKWIISTTKEVR